MAVVHSRDITTAGVSGVPLQAMYYMTGFLGTYVPVFDIAPQNMLVRPPPGVRIPLTKDVVSGLNVFSLILRLLLIMPLFGIT